ncbi:MAG: aminoacyl-tRNA hydrolase [Kiritimatiellia bacterium]|jgi:PTH1 family peptidyl-tRNA hydrolase|nr:aminoacyl-tRNA hydrolase [Kiritimatiellia bacterium]
MIAGLGNPGEAYANTPHNVGFDVVDLLAERLGGSWKHSSRFHAFVARTRCAEEPLLLVKPQTFMNLSGTSVVPLLRYYGGEPGDLTVVLDDADLPLGTLRIRAAGGTGGHRGLTSVMEALGSDAFARVRLGVGREGRGSLADHVLGKFDEARQEKARAVVEAAADAVLCLTEKGLNEAMNRYNGWRADAPLPPDDRK